MAGVPGLIQNPPQYLSEIPSQFCIQAHTSSLRCSGSLGKVQNNANFYTAAKLSPELLTITFDAHVEILPSHKENVNYLGSILI